MSPGLPAPIGAIHSTGGELAVASDQQDDASEIDADKLFSKFERHSDPVVEGKIELLPLHDRLRPENFERLIARLADPVAGAAVQGRCYGKSGSTQGGIVSWSSTRPLASATTMRANAGHGSPRAPSRAGSTSF